MTRGLEKYLQEQGISQVEFARRMNVSESCVSQWITRRRTPRPEYMAKIKRITEGAVTPDDWIKTYEIQFEANSSQGD